jgi:FkbM family methyltransferase
MNVIQIGANKGCNSDFNGPDDFFNLIKDYDFSNLILVEPLDIHISSLKERYVNIKNLNIENIAITNDSSCKELDFFYHKDDGPLYLVASTDPFHITKHGFSMDGIIKKTVPCLSINELFEKYSLQEIDILCIDTEGLDGDILKSINFEKFKIKEIYYEYTHQKFDIASFLKTKGYSVFESWRDTNKAVLNFN